MLDVVSTRFRREDLKPGEVLCDHCTAKCCKYFAMPMERPENRKDYDYIRWFLLHQQASAFVEDGTWYLLVHTQCKHLLPDNRCGIYETRPQICREYTTADCEFDEEWVYEQYFETAEQVAEYMEAVLPRKRGESLRSPRPALLQVL